MAVWKIYIIETEADTLYTGITTDLEKRWLSHAAGKGAKYLRAHKPKSIVFVEGNHDRSSASAREAEIKKLSRIQKQHLIADKSVNEIQEFMPANQNG